MNISKIKDAYYFTQRRLSRWLLTVTLYINSPLISAVLWLFYIRRIKDINVLPDAGASVLVINNAHGFSDLIEAYQDTCSPYTYYTIDEECLRAAANYFLGYEIGDYAYGMNVNDNKKRLLRTYVAKTFSYMQRVYKFRGIIAFNFVYHALRELIVASVGLGVPYVIVYKESLRTYGYLEATKKIFKERLGKFAGEMFLVNNDETKNLLIGSSVAVNDQIEVVGHSRADYLFRALGKKSAKKSSGRRKKIIYYAISEFAGLPIFGDEFCPVEVDGIILPANYSFADLANKTLSEIIKFAQKNPDVDCLIKGKSGGYYSNSNDKLERTVLPENLLFIHGRPDLSVLIDADVVIGLNTTALLEALVLEIPFIVPVYDMDDYVLKNYTLHFLGLEILAKTTSELYSLIEKNVKLKEYPTVNKEIKKQVLDRYIGNSDGMASQRLSCSLDKIFKEK